MLNKQHKEKCWRHNIGHINEKYTLSARSDYGIWISDYGGREILLFRPNIALNAGGSFEACQKVSAICSMRFRVRIHGRKANEASVTLQHHNLRRSRFVRFAEKSIWSRTWIEVISRKRCSPSLDVVFDELALLFELLLIFFCLPLDDAFPVEDWLFSS